MPHLKLRDYRIKRGMTLEQVGKATFYSWSTIERAEVGTMYSGTKRKDKRTDTFWQTMSEFYKVPVEELRRVVE